MNVLDLFSGIGGFSLGLERAWPSRTVAFCEIDPFCRRVLAERWPGIPIHHDIRELSGEQFRNVDVICGGFPCQDISAASAGKARGLAGERSGLWFEMARLVRDIRPSWVIIENVPRLRTLGVDRVLDDLEGAGYAPAPPMVVGAVHAGAPHLRKRVWIVAYSKSLAGRSMEPASRHRPQPSSSVARTAADADCEPIWTEPGRSGWTRRAGPTFTPIDVSNAYGQSESLGTIDVEMAWISQSSTARTRPWEIGPFDSDEVVDGLSADVDDALRAYGNSVLPQIPEAIGRAIMNIVYAPSTKDRP